MRPLMELLEEERNTIQRLESIYLYLTRADNPEWFDYLYAKRNVLENDLEAIRAELKEYIENLLYKES